ncbi:Protein argonaute [Trichinella spiralis]|uniref:Protein argonaute n=1 Tax=Trichinella spiralis TaxID=6334 RepID=A0ABR3KH02_TRISP
MCEQSQDTNVAADEVLQLRLKELVKRPGYGTVGKPIKLACNYFPLIKLQKAEPMIVDGRVLPPPRLEYGKGNGGRQIILTPKDGAWNSNEFKFFESAYCESFGFVSFLPPHKASMLQEFCLQIVRTCRNLVCARARYHILAALNSGLVENLRPCSLSYSCSIKFWASGKVF